MADALVARGLSVAQMEQLLLELCQASTLYRFITRRTVSDLVIHGISYAAWKYSLTRPPSTFRR